MYTACMQLKILAHGIYLLPFVYQSIYLSICISIYLSMVKLLIWTEIVRNKYQGGGGVRG